MSSMPSRICTAARKSRRRAAGQIHLRDVTGDDDLRSETEAGQEHLHLLGGGVLRLVEDDERVIERVVCEQEILGDIQRVRSRDLDAHGFLGARGLDAVDETHRPTAAGRVVLRGLAGEPERDNALGQADVEDVCVRTVMHVSTRRQSRLPPLAILVRWFATPPSDWTRNITSSRRRAEAVEN